MPKSLIRQRYAILQSSWFGFHQSSVVVRHLRDILTPSTSFACSAACHPTSHPKNLHPAHHLWSNPNCLWIASDNLVDLSFSYSSFLPFLIGSNNNFIIMIGQLMKGPQSPLMVEPLLANHLQSKSKSTSVLISTSPLPIPIGTPECLVNVSRMIKPC